MNVNRILHIRVGIQTRLRMQRIMPRKHAHKPMHRAIVARRQVFMNVSLIPACIQHRPFRVVVLGVHRR